MAILLFQTTSLSRAEGRSAPSSAAYRAGERLRDEVRGTVYDHSRRQDVQHKEILLPTALAGLAPDWVSNRNELWNAAERAEKRVNSRVGREYLVGLPHELNAAARLDLARRFAADISDRYGTVVDLAVHAPRSAGDPRNFHAHLLTTTRQITSEGFGAKAAIERSDSVRREQGLLSAREELKFLRAHWAERANEALLNAGLEIRLDPRTLKEQGIDRAPQKHIPMAVIQMERRGIATEFMRELRAGQSLETPSQSPALSRGEERQASLSAMPKLTMEDAKQLARERWLAYRAEQSLQLRSSAAERFRERNEEWVKTRDAGMGMGD